MMTAASIVPKRRLQWSLDLLVAFILCSSAAQAAEVALPSLPTDLAAYRVGQSYSGLLIADPTTREMEWDDVANPGMLWVERAQALWEQRDGQAGKACGDCAVPPRAIRRWLPMAKPCIPSKTASTSAANSRCRPLRGPMTVMRWWR